MAKLSFIATTISENEIELQDIISYELCRDIDAPCDGLRIKLNCKPMEELTKIKAFIDSKLIFNGYVDTQRDTLNENGAECFIYARSSASILLDNEAEPRNYSYPTVTALFHINIDGLGFESKLPELSNEHNYLVNKGVSRYGAINNFVRGITGKSITVTPNNELVVPDGNGTIDFDSLSIISEKRLINRGGLLSQIDYKIEGDVRYSRHTKSRFLEDRGISSTKKINLSSQPLWQRENTALSLLSNASGSYYKMEITVDGCVMPILYDRAVGNSNFQNLDGYYVTNACLVLDSKGERTAITLCKDFDLEAITYVVE